MFFGNKRIKPQSRIDSLIGIGTKVEGDVVFSGGLRLDGYVKGNVVAEEGKPSTLVLSEQARVDGAIRVSHVVINGTVNGPVYASEYVELQAKSRVIGDVCYKTLEMHLGAVIEGRLVHQQDGQEDAVVELKAVSK